MKLDLEGKKIWILVRKAFGEPRDIPLEGIKSIKDKIVLSGNEGTYLKISDCTRVS